MQRIACQMITSQTMTSDHIGNFKLATSNFFLLFSKTAARVVENLKPKLTIKVDMSSSFKECVG